MIGHVDADNFYCACEIAFRPDLAKRPLCVMSCNDGNVIARNKEAKALGIRMGQPVHEVQPLTRSQGVVLSSANFALYGDMSRRMHAVVRDMAPRHECYSIDELFLDLTREKHPVAFARTLRDRVRRYTSIQTTVGLSTTKTLAKCGTEIGKSSGGIGDLSTPELRASALSDFPIGDVWGVGPRWRAKLEAIGITTAAQLRDAASDLIQNRFGVVLGRTQRELQGMPCLSITDVQPDRQQIVVSHSFGRRVTDHAAIEQAIATFAVRACERLREQGLVAAGIHVFANSDVFRPELRQHHPSCTLPLLPPSSDTRVVLTHVSSMLRRFFQDDVAYKRAGVALLDLARPSAAQGDLFAPAGRPNSDTVMGVVDRINRRFGPGAVGFGATGWQDQPAWAMHQRNISPRYTTRWSDIPRALC